MPPPMPALPPYALKLKPPPAPLAALAAPSGEEHEDDEEEEELERLRFESKSALSAALASAAEAKARTARMPPPLTAHAGLAPVDAGCARCVVHALAARSASSSCTFCSLWRVSRLSSAVTGGEPPLADPAVLLSPWSRAVAAGTGASFQRGARMSFLSTAKRWVEGNLQTFDLHRSGLAH